MGTNGTKTGRKLWYVCRGCRAAESAEAPAKPPAPGSVLRNAGEVSGMADDVADLAALIRSFHTLASRGVTSVEGAREVAQNASNSAGTRAAAAFVLHVAERAPFDLAGAWRAWDREQREAYAAWEAAPWWMSVRNRPRSGHCPAPCAHARTWPVRWVAGYACVDTGEACRDCGAVRNGSRWMPDEPVDEELVEPLAPHPLALEWKR